MILGYNEKNIIRTIIPQTLRLWTWIFYFYLGGYINKTGIYIEKYANKYIVIVFTLICIIYEFYIVRYVLKDLCAENFYDCVFIDMWIALIFAYIYKLNIKERYNTIIAKVSSNTMGVYLIHEFILMGINKVYKFGNGLINILVFIGLFFSAYILTCLLKKVPILNKFFT